MGADPKNPGSEPELSKWDLVSEEELVRCPIFELHRRRLRHAGRLSEGDFYVLKTRDWVNVIPLTPDFQVVLVRQFRFGLEDFSWEIPGGVMEAGEDPLLAGARELREETGFAPESCELLGSVAANPAIMNNRCHFVWARNVRASAALEWDEHEEIEVKLFPVDEVYAMAARGDICHSLVVAALMRFYPQWERIRARRRSAR